MSEKQAKRRRKLGLDRKSKSNFEWSKVSGKRDFTWLKRKDKKIIEVDGDYFECNKDDKKYESHEDKSQPI